MGAFFTGWGILLGLFFLIRAVAAYRPQWPPQRVKRRDSVSFHIYRNRPERLGRFVARHYNAISFIVVALSVALIIMVIGTINAPVDFD